MTLEEYYIAKTKLKAPENFGFLQERNWYRIEIAKLKLELSESDLAIVESRQNEWQRKVNSSHN